MMQSQPTLLIVDDEATDIDLLVASLGDDYVVQVATDGATALRTMALVPPDLILLDVLMPGMDGFELCRRLKEDPSFRGIPVLFLTARNDAGAEVRGLEMGAVDYITKPFHSVIVRARVRNQIELKRHRDQLACLVDEKSHELAEAYERLRELNHLQNEFLRMISHEMRTPANGLMGAGELILELLPESNESQLYGTLFQRSSERLSRLIDDATILADLETSSERGNGQVISLAILLDDLLATIEGIRILLDAPTLPVWPLIRGNHALLKTALQTMVLLASSLSREKREVRIVGDTQGSRVRLRTVVDELTLLQGQADRFFDMGSLARLSSGAEPLGLAPVAAERIFTAFGGGMKLVKQGERGGFLEVYLVQVV